VPTWRSAWRRGVKVFKLSICFGGDGDIGAQNVEFFPEIDGCDIFVEDRELKSTMRADESLGLPGISR
jgi:hypothetical protein